MCIRDSPYRRKANDARRSRDRKSSLRRDPRKIHSRHHHRTRHRSRPVQRVAKRARHTPVAILSGAWAHEVKPMRSRRACPERSRRDPYSLIPRRHAPGNPPRNADRLAAQSNNVQKRVMEKSRTMSEMEMFRQRLKPLIEGSVDTDQVRNFEEGSESSHSR